MLVLMYPCTFIPFNFFFFLLKGWICAENTEHCQAIKYLKQLKQVKWKIAYISEIYSNKFISYSLGFI